MTLPTPRPVSGETVLSEGTTSIATTPVPMYFVAPRAGTIERLLAASAGTTTGTIALAVTINGGSDITGGAFTIPAGAGNVSSVYEPGMLDGAHVNEGDLIAVTPSGGTGASIAGGVSIVIR